MWPKFWSRGRPRMRKAELAAQPYAVICSDGKPPPTLICRCIPKWCLVTHTCLGSRGLRSIPNSPGIRLGLPRLNVFKHGGITCSFRHLLCVRRYDLTTHKLAPLFSANPGIITIVQQDGRKGQFCTILSECHRAVWWPDLCAGSKA